MANDNIVVKVAYEIDAYLASFWERLKQDSEARRPEEIKPIVPGNKPYYIGFRRSLTISRREAE